MDNVRQQELTRVLAGQSRPFVLSGLNWPFHVTVLMLAPHPDDFDAIASTMKYFQDNGHRVDVACGRTGSGIEDSYCDPSTDEHKAVIREAEQRKSCELFGLPEGHLEFMQMEEDEELQPRENAANCRIVEDQLARVQPDIVFLPHGNDTNTGHQRMASMLRSVVSALGVVLTAFLVKDPKTVELRVDTFLPFGETLGEWKAALLRCHDSQNQRNLNTRGQGFDNRILAVNKAIAEELGVDSPYAEAFEINNLK